MLLLAENPEKLQKVFQEIEMLNQNNKTEYETLSKAVYLNAVLLESLRLFPHASMYVFLAKVDFNEKNLKLRLQSRLSMADCILDDGTFIPAGVGILFDTWKLHRDPYYWGSNVNKFIPER